MAGCGRAQSANAHGTLRWLHLGSSENRERSPSALPDKVTRPSSSHDKTLQCVSDAVSCVGHTGMSACKRNNCPSRCPPRGAGS